jgi:glutathione S-transferase
MKRRLEAHCWLASERPTIGDIACYPYVFLAGEGDFSLEIYPAVQGWLKRVQGIDGWMPMVNPRTVRNGICDIRTR